MASSGTPIRCDRTVWFNELECGRGLIRAEDANGGEEKIWTVTEKEAFHDSMHFRLWGSD